jgi:hypothetical protein
VGWSNGTNKGYDKSNATTYATEPGTTADHLSPWFYEELGTSEYSYTGSAGFYKSVDDGLYVYNNYKSVNANQYLRYWDLAYTNTNFYCYAPYNSKVTFTHTDATETKTGTSTMTFPAGSIRDGYDLPLNSAYKAYSRTLGEYMYAGVQATNASLADVTVPFKHMGAQLYIRFYEDIPGYKVEIINLDDDHGKLADGISKGDITHGIQATPAIMGEEATKYTKEQAKAFNASLPGALAANVALTEAQTTAYNAACSGSKNAGDTLDDDEAAAYNATLVGAKTTNDYRDAPSFTNGTYYISQGATVSFAESDAAASYTANWNSGATTATNTTPLMFQIPQATVTTVASTPAANVTDYSGLSGRTHKIIKEKVNDGAQAYSYSPTVYYPVAQPTTSTTGLTFHISYRIIAEDNKEVTTIHNATVHVTYKGTASAADGTKTADQFITVWQPNVKYTYTFKITRNSSGTTNPDTAIDPTSPDESDTKSLYPIVFDAATIDDYTENFTEYIVSEDTNY